MAPIVRVPDPVLRIPAQPVTQLDERVLNIIKDMISTLKSTKNPQGVGLAAPQVGVPLRLFVTRPLPDKTISVFINPEIIKYSQRTQSPAKNRGTYEGCLSLPGHYAPVTRSMSVTVKYMTLATQPGQSERAQPDAFRQSSTRDWTGESQLAEKIESFSGFPAHIIQHEMDHLNGILFIDRVLEQNIKLYKVEGKDWTEINL